jgi:hypothetical protein
MSADNGIYILQTYGPEYRVAHCQGIDSIYGKFNDDTFHWDGDPEMILEYFAEAPVFTDVEKALDFATELSYDYEYLEYGICLIPDFKELKFSEL